MNGSPADEDDTMTGSRLSIGDFGRASGLTAKALRWYDDQQLLVPADVDPFTGYRRYDHSQLDRARTIAQLRRVGMSLARVAHVLELAPQAAAAELTSYAREVTAQAAVTREQLALIVTALVSNPADRPGKETPMTTTTTTVSVSDVGSRHEQGGRDAQLDAVHVGDDIFAVADGFGDDPEPARAALHELVESLAEQRTLDALDHAVAAAAASVGACGAGSGCTLTAMVVVGGEVLVAHIGDSRAYRVRAGRMEQLTRDHSVVQFLVDEGRLTPEEARLDDQRVVLHRALGPHDDVAVGAPDLAVHRVLPGDRLVLTTDGVHARIDAPTLAQLLIADEPAQEVADTVVSAVEEAGADDNLSVVVVNL